MSFSDDLFGPTETVARDGAEVLKALQQAARERILILDGAMGTEIQQFKFDEDHFRGDKFIGCACHQQGNNDLLSLSQPAAIEDIHYRYAIAGADILETNTFSSTVIAQADYGMEDAVYELNRMGAQLARRGGQRAEREDGRRRFVAGALGPTVTTAEPTVMVAPARPRPRRKPKPPHGSRPSAQARKSSSAVRRSIPEPLPKPIAIRMRRSTRAIRVKIFGPAA